MSDPVAPKPRRWFQFHLSTCIVMMLVFGFEMYANLMPTFQVSYGRKTGKQEVYVTYGWPVPAHAEYQPRVRIIPNEKELGFNAGDKEVGWLTYGVLLDAAWLLFIPFVAIYLSEYLARHREARKP